jgi:hypothetical protein
LSGNGPLYSKRFYDKFWISNELLRVLITIMLFKKIIRGKRGLMQSMFIRTILNLLKTQKHYLKLYLFNLAETTTLTAGKNLAVIFF